MVFLKKFILHILLGLVLAIMFMSLILTKFNNNEIKRNLKLKAQAEDIKQTNSLVLREVLHGVDLGLRGYAITSKESLLQPMRNAEQYNKEIFIKLQIELESQHYDTKELKLVHDQVNKYIMFCQGMAKDVQNGQLPLFVEKLNEDKGYYAWKAWDDHTKNLHAFEDDLISSADKKVEKAMVQNLWIKVLLLGFSFPTFSLALFVVYRQNKNRKKLLLDLEETNRKYLFDSGITIKGSSEVEILESSKQNMRQTAEFVKSVAAGNYHNVWQGLDEFNKELNIHTIAGELLLMQQQMEEVKMLDSRRLWATEGLEKFSELIRNNNTDRMTLASKAVSFLVKHLQGQQACLYIKRFDDGTNSNCLELVAQYAYDVNNRQDKIVYEGEGIVGQSFKDKKTIHLIDIPENFTQITSGIGAAKPTNLIVVPFKFQDVVEAVFEISGFHLFKKYEIEFLEKAGEYFSSALAN